MSNCPWCNADIQEYLETDLTECLGENSNDFEDECPKCEKEIKVEVEWDPIFDVEKKE